MASVEVSIEENANLTSEDFLAIKEKALQIQKRQNIQLQKFLTRLEMETLRLAFIEEKKNSISKFYLTCFDAADNASTFQRLLKMPLKEQALQKFMKRLEGFSDIQAMIKEIERVGKDIDAEAKEKQISLTSVKNEFKEKGVSLKKKKK